MTRHDIDAAVRGLKPVPTPDRVSDQAWDDLSDRITGLSPVAAVAPVAAEPVRRSPRPRRVLLAAACLTLIAGAVAATLVSRPHQDQPQALSFTERGDKLIVRVVDPNADPGRYNADFKRMGLRITVEAVAVSPPWVGKMVSYSGRNEHEMEQIRMLAPGEECSGTLDASDPGCQEGVELAKDFDGTSVIQFGRKARPGELYWHTSGSATDKGEVLAGLTVHGKTIAEVLPLVRSRGVRTVGYETGGKSSQRVESPPMSWYVDDASTYAEGSVTLYVGPVK